MAENKLFIKFNLARIFFLAVIFTFALTGIFAFMPLFGAIAASFIIAYIFEPFIGYFERKHLSRGWGIALFFIGTTASFILSAYFIKTNLPAPGELNNIVMAAEKSIIALRESLEKNYNFVDWLALFNILDENLKSGSQVTSSLKMIIKGITGTSTFLLVVPFCTFFFMLKGHEMRKEIMSYIPNRYFEITYMIMRDIDNIFGGYIRGILLESVIIGLVSFAGLYIIGFPFWIAVVCGIIAGVTNAVPYIGPWFGAIIGVAVFYLGFIPEGFVSFAGLRASFFTVALVYALAQLFDNVAVKPLVIGSSVNLHPVMVILGIIAGGNLFGFVGVLFAIPVIAIINVATRTLYNQLKGYKMLEGRLFEIRMER